MQLTPYAELVELSPAEREKKNATAKINKQKQKGLLKLAELEEKISSLEDEVISLCSKQELDFDLIVDKQDDLALVQRRKEKFTEVINQLFPSKQ